jgi:hypothetical protein
VARLGELFRRGAFPRVASFTRELAERTQAQFVQRLQSTRPRWWGRQALSTGPGGGGGILIRTIAGGHEVFYAGRGAYNYLRVIEGGRPRYHMVPALLRSPRARSGPRGRYIIIPLKEGGEKGNPDQPSEPANAVLKRTGYTVDSEGKRRSKYKVFEPGTGRGNVYGSAQGPIKSGLFQYSWMKFVIVSERTRNWWYPAIPPQPIQKPLQDQIDRHLQKPETQAYIRELVEQDVEAFLTRQR